MISLQEKGEASAVRSAAKLELLGLRKAFGPTSVVNGVDLAVANGESVVLLGPSGCGKTTILRMIAGFERPDSGEVRLDGRVVASPSVSLPPEKRRLGMVFQSYAVWPHKTVFENVAYGLVVAGMKRAAIQARVANALETVKLQGLESRYSSELSGGQQQRVALARAIVTEPSMLLLDEPLSNLDAGLRYAMRLELRELQKRTGVTSLYVTHDQEEALVLADRVVVMSKGVVEQIGSPEDVYLRPASRFVASFLGATNLLDGTVEEKDPGLGRIRVATRLKASLWCRAAPEHIGRCAVGEVVAVAIRPEGILLDPLRASDGASVSARLMGSSFLGNRYDLHFEVDGVVLTCQSARMDGIRDGEARLYIEPNQAWVVP